MEEIIIKITKQQHDAIVDGIETLLHIAATSPNLSYSFGIDLRKVMRLQSGLRAFHAAQPERVGEVKGKPAKQ